MAEHPEERPVLRVDERGDPKQRPLKERRESTLRWLRAEVAREGDFRRLAQAVCGHLYRNYEHYSWVGIYMIEGDRLKLWAWDGPQPTQHVEIPLHAGLCGWAASTGQIANVPDVSKDERYLQCFASCKSEIVVPIAHEGRVFGEIDIDSDELAAFDGDDERFLQQICDLLGARYAATGAA